MPIRPLQLLLGGLRVGGHCYVRGENYLILGIVAAPRGTTILCWKWKTGEAALTKLRAQPSEARDARERNEGLNITVCSKSTDYILPLFMDSRCQSME